MKAFALLLVLAVTAILLFAGADAGRQAINNHRAAQAQALEF